MNFASRLPGLGDESKGGQKTPFLVFSEDFREQVKQKFPRLSVNQVMSVVLTRWEMLSKDQRQPFEKRSMDDKKRLEGQVCSPTNQNSM